MDILLVDDHELVRNGIKALLEGEEDIKVIAEASNGLDALEILEEKNPDVLVVDIRMPKLNGIQVVEQVTKKGLNVRTMVLSMHDSEEYVLESIKAGADGYLLKGSSKEEFLKALRAVAAGGKYYSGDISEVIINNLTGQTKSTETKSTLPKVKYNLTKRENQILELILEGKSNKEIAELLEVSKRTTEVHRFNLMKKLEVKNLMELSNKINRLSQED